MSDRDEFEQWYSQEFDVAKSWIADRRDSQHGYSDRDLYHAYRGYMQAGQQLTAAQSEIEALRGRVVELESALRPFAAEAEYVPDDAVDIHLNYMMDGAEILERAEFSAENIHTAAQRLRQQADQLERGEGDGT